MNSGAIAATPSMFGSMPGSNSQVLAANPGLEASTQGDPSTVQSVHRCSASVPPSSADDRRESANVVGAKDNGTGEKVEGTERPEESEEGEDDKTRVDIFINNVVCSFSVKCHLNLRKIGQFGSNVEYRREYGKVNMRFRNPPATATIWSSGKITITGNDSEYSAKKTARKCARALQRIGFTVRFSNYKVVNVLGTTSMPFAIRIRDFSEEHPRLASYEPELHPAVTYRLRDPKATLKIFSTGSITVTAPSVGNINSAIHHIYPLVERHKMPLSAEQLEKKKLAKKKQGRANPRDEENTDDELEEEEEEEDEEDSLDEEEDESDDE
ncbi:TATA box-binding protein-like 1 [Diadema setosum]|uniref:TATA box-binding protein-like 1 n=1 Tax=Diadema setosum TaxID=31175 RepID=UPI003B3B168E